MCVGVSPRQPLSHERNSSSEDDECSRATAIAATKQPASLTTELTRSRKRRRRKKQANVNDIKRNGASSSTMNGGVGIDYFATCKQPSIIPILSQGVEGHHKCLDLVTDGDYRHEHIATNVHVGCQPLIEGDDNERSKLIYPLDKQQSLRGGCPESVTLKGLKRRHILRGGAATTYCDNKTTKRYPNTSPPCESNVHPDAMLSNSQSTNSSRTRRASTDVVKQWTPSKQLHDQSGIRTPPTHYVDHDDPLMSAHVGMMDTRLMDMSLHKAVTMETRLCRKWRRRHRKRLSMKVGPLEPC